MIIPSPTSISPWLNRPLSSVSRVRSRKPNARASQSSAAMPSSTQSSG
jgi:hypothetical protein